MVKHPLVSVIVPTANRAGLVERAVRSIVNSDYPAIELMVVDQNSQDNTRELLQSLGVAWTSDTGLGAGHGRKEGLARTNGDLVLFLDSDDWLPPSALSHLVGKAVETGSALTYGYCLRADIEGDTVKIWPPESAKLAPLASTTLTQRSVFCEQGIFDDDNHSWPRWIIQARTNHVTEATVDQVVAYRGVHSHNVSREQGSTKEIFALVRAHRESRLRR